MLHERLFENMTRGIVQGQAILDTHLPISATKLRLTKLFGIENINKKEILVTNALFDIRKTSVCVTSWKIVIRSRETGETIWVRAFAHKSEAALVYMRLIGIDIERVGNEPITFPGVWQEGDFEYAFATVQSYTSGTTTWTAPDGVTKTDYLVVAGGAGGGPSYGGGGGAGGFRTATNYSVTPLSSYTVTVGTYGNGSNAWTDPGLNGSDSVFATITSTGGGAGGANQNTSVGTGASGGSGGGGGGWGGQTNGGGSGTSGQGNNGGASNPNLPYCGGGGGGASAVGGTSTTYTAGGGGNGTASSISGSSSTYAGGGGGGVAIYNTGVGGSGGSGGGGAGANYSVVYGTAGTTNTGGGGGGGGGSDYTLGRGGNGGSGIVILSYTPAVIQGNFNSPMLGM